MILCHLSGSMYASSPLDLAGGVGTLLNGDNAMCSLSESHRKQVFTAGYVVLVVGTWIFVEKLREMECFQVTDAKCSDVL